MKLFLMGMEKFLYLLKDVHYPDIWLQASKISQKSLDLVLRYSDTVIVEFDVYKSLEGDYLSYPIDITDGNIGVSFSGGKFSRRKSQLVLTDIAVEAPYPYIIKKTPYYNLTNLLQKTTFGIYGVRYANTVRDLFTKDLHFSYNPKNGNTIFTKTSVIRCLDPHLQDRALRNLETLMNIRLQRLGNSCIVDL